MAQLLLWLFCYAAGFDGYFSAIYVEELWTENMISQPIVHLCQQVQLLTLPTAGITKLKKHNHYKTVQTVVLLVFIKKNNFHSSMI